MSNKVCCVPGCSNRSGSVALHRFPNPVVNKDRFNTWVYSVGGEILGLSNDHIFKYRRICRKHFEEKYWCRNNLLSNIAVPTKNMSDSRSVLHLFPNPAKDMDRFKSWLFNIGGDILAFNNEYIYKNRRVCHAHFEPKYCCRNNRISNIAVPTFNLPDLNLKEEHNYCLKVDNQEAMPSESYFILRPGASHKKLHTFPNPNKYPDRFEAWRQAVGGKILELSFEYIYKYRRVCHAHFEDKFRCRYERLSNIAIPTINVAGKAIDSVRPLEADPLADDVDDFQDVTAEPQNIEEVKVKKLKVDNLVKLPESLCAKPGTEEADPLADDVDDFQNVTPEPQNFEEVKVKKVKVDNLVKLPESLCAKPGTEEADPLADDVDDFQNVTPEPQNFEEVKVKKVKVDNLVKLPESLCAKPGTEDDNSELYLLDILDPDLLTDRIEPENFDSISDNLHTTLSRAWPPVLAGGLAVEAKQKIIGRYPRPNNCKLLQTPTMNSKMVELVPEKIVVNDDKWFKMQQCVGTAITAISRAMEMLMLCQSREEALRHLTNSCLILCDLHYTHTKIRKINVTPFVDDITKAVIKDCQNRDETLFGPNFIGKWRTAKKLEPKPKKVKKKVPKSVKVKKKKATSSGPSLVAYSGQWHPPLQKVRNRRSMAGARRPPAGAAPQTPGRRRLRQPRPGGSPGVKRNLTKQLKQIEQYDAFSNEITSTPPDIEESYSHMQTDTEDRCVQGEVTDDVSKQSSNRNTAVGRTNYGAGTKITVMNRTKQIEHYDAWGNKISSTPPDIETSHSHMQTQMEARHTQVEPVVDQINQPRNTNKPKIIILSSKKLQQNDAFGNRITSIPTSHSHMQTQMEARHMQVEPAVDQLNQPRNTNKPKIMILSTKKLQQNDAFGNTITSIPTSNPHIPTQMEARHTQVEPVVNQLNQPRNTNKPKNAVKRRNPSDDTKPRMILSTKKLQQTEQNDTFGNTITSIPTTSHPHMQIQTEGASRTRPVHEDPPSRRYTQAPHVQPTINYYPNNTVIITKGATKPLVLPPQMPSRDMPTLHSNEMPALHSNDDPPDLVENVQTPAQVRHGIVDTVTEVDTESGVSLLLQFRHS